MAFHTSLAGDAITRSTVIGHLKSDFDPCFGTNVIASVEDNHIIVGAAISPRVRGNIRESTGSFLTGNIMLRKPQKYFGFVALLSLSTYATTTNEGLNVHEDYYRGFAHGAYYGLMLGGVDYHVAWCMKVELEYEAEGMGTGADFQRKMESMLDRCRKENSND